MVNTFRVLNARKQRVAWKEKQRAKQKVEKIVNLPCTRVNFAFDGEAARADDLNPRTRSSIEAYTWYRDSPAMSRPRAPGWYFLTGDGWTEFGPTQNEELESCFISTSERLCKVSKGHNLQSKAHVDFDRMLLLDPLLPDFASTALALPDALPVLRIGRPSTVIQWNVSGQALTVSDSQALSLAHEAGRPSLVLYGLVLYGMRRAVLIDLKAYRWSCCLEACGYTSTTSLTSSDTTRGGPVGYDHSPTLVSDAEDEYILDSIHHDDYSQDNEQASCSDSSSVDEHHTPNHGPATAIADLATAPRDFQQQLDSLVAMGFAWKDAQWALSRTSTLEDATELLLVSPSSPPSSHTTRRL